MCSRLGGLLGVQVLSFSRLCERVLQERGDGLPVIGGQYWDRIIWALGAERLREVTGDDAFARFAYDTVRRTMDCCLEEEYDPADGLFRGAAVYGDGISAYPPEYRNPSLSSGISSIIVMNWETESESVIYVFLFP